MRGLIDWMLAWLLLWRRPAKPFYGENIEGDVK